MIYDCIIIGGGPSGASCAKKCAENGLDTLLLEKEERNRYKACGGGISIKTANLLGDIPAERVERIGRIEIKSRKSHYLNLDENIYSGRTGYMVYRTEFDQWLRDRAERVGVHVLHEAEVRDVERSIDYVRVTLKDGEHFKGNAFIVAAGMNAPFLKTLGLEVPRGLLAVQKEYYLNEELVDERFGEFGVLSFDSVNYSGHGYAWAFPKRKGVTVGIGDDAVYGSELIDRLERYVKRDPYVSEKLTGVKETEINGVHLSAYMVPNEITGSTFGERMLVVGDSGGFADPFSSEGISYGIMSGMLAAETLSTAVEMDDYSKENLSRYKEKWVEEIFEPWIKYSGMIAKMVYGNKEMDLIMDRILDLANENHTFGMGLTDLISGIVDRKTAYNKFMSQKIHFVRKFGVFRSIAMLRRAKSYKM